MARIKGRTPSSGGDFWGYARSFLHQHMPKVRQLSLKTVETYTVALEGFIDYMAHTQGQPRESICFDCFCGECLRGWVDWMTTSKGYASCTVRLRLSAIRSFLKYSASRDISLVTLYEHSHTIELPKAQRRQVEYLTENATRAILAAFCDATAKHRRNRAMLILSYDCAARVSEICGMCLGDLAFGKCPSIRLTGKGDKTRTVPLMARTAEHMKAYVKEFHPGQSGDGTSVSPPLFYSRHSTILTRLSPDAVENVLKKAGGIARQACTEVPDRLYVHLLRKTRAKNLYEDGVPLEIIMRFLGHESMATTSTFYAFATQDMIRKAMLNASPKVIAEMDDMVDEKMLDKLFTLR